jgi:hypothetical protein
MKIEHYAVLVDENYEVVFEYFMVFILFYVAVFIEV